MARNEAPLLDDLFEFEGQRLPSLHVIDRDADILCVLKSMASIKKI